MEPADVARAIECDGVLKDEGAEPTKVLSQYFAHSTPVLLSASGAIAAACDVALIPYAPELVLVPWLTCREQSVPVVFLAHSPALVPVPAALIDGSSMSASSILNTSMVSQMLGQVARAAFLPVYDALSLPRPSVLEALPFPSLWSCPMLLMYPTTVHTAGALGVPAWFHQTGPLALPSVTQSMLPDGVTLKWFA